MADTIKTNLGPVTAYADAKAHGYTGTREEFGVLLANAGLNLKAAETAKEGAEAAKQAAETAQQAAAENQKNTETQAANAKASADTAAEQAAVAKESAADAANSATAAQESETNAGLSATAAANAEAAAQQAQNAAETAKADAETAKTAAGNSADAAANSAADAKKTLESIPADYSTLSGKVNENTSGISQLKEELIAYEIDEKNTKCGCVPADESSVNSKYLFHIKANSIYQIYVTVNSGTYDGSGTFGIRDVSTEGKFGDGEFGKKTHGLTVTPETNMYTHLFVYFRAPLDISTIDVTFTIFEIEKSALYGQRRIETAKYENLQFVKYLDGMITKTDYLFTAKDHYYMLSWKLKKGRISYKGTFGIVDGEEAKFDNRATEGRAVFKVPKTDNHKFFVYIGGYDNPTVDIEIKDVTGLENLFPIADNVLSLRETNAPFSIYENIEMAVKKDSVTALLSSTGKKVGINPVLNKNFPDPSVIKIGDFYYAFGTGTPCYIYTSPDLIHWSLYSSVFPTDFNYNAIFGDDFVDMWANDINLINGKLVDFIGVNYGSDEKKRKLIAMVSDSIDSAFSYAGVVIDSYYNSQNINPIDAEYAEANGNSYIIAGSYNGIYIYSYDKSTMKYDGKTKKKIVKEGSNEGSYIYKNGNYYYLFTSNGDYGNYTYKICISRSENIEGPYLNKNGNDVTVEDPTPILYSLQNHPLYGPGHNGEIFVDADNRYYMPMHCHIDGAPNNERHMILMQLKFGSDGWPFLLTATEKKLKIQTYMFYSLKLTKGSFSRLTNRKDNKS